MSTFMPGGGFALSDYRSFDPAVPHQLIHVPATMARQTYNYIDYSPTALTLVAEGKWPTLVAAALSTPLPAHKVLTSTPQSFHKTISFVAVSSVPRPSRKVATVAAVSSAPRPSRKAATIAAASSASRHSHKAATPIPRSAHKTSSVAVTALSVPDKSHIYAF
ncbi:hypothetical protein ACLOJK_038362 [Asimina triloba]